MVDVLNVINTAYELYKEKWRSVVTAFAVVFVITFIFGVINFVAQLPGNFICDENSPFQTQNTLLILVFCVSPAILQRTTEVLTSLISLLITMAVLKPMDEIAAGKPVSSWTVHFPKQILNAILVILFRAIVLAVCFIPFMLTLIPVIPVLIASKNNFAFLAGGGAVLLLTLLLGFLLSLVLNFLLSFLEIEIVIGENGILDAVSKSARLVINNFLDVLLFSLLWVFIGLGVGIVTFFIACTICLLPIAWLIPAFIVQPIKLLSKVILWRRLKSLG